MIEKQRREKRISLAASTDQCHSTSLHRRRIEQHRATRGSQASQESTNGNHRLPHLTAMCYFSALLQSLRINADITIQSNITELLEPNNTLDKVE